MLPFIYSAFLNVFRISQNEHIENFIFGGRLVTKQNLDNRILIVLALFVLIGMFISDGYKPALQVNLRNSNHFAQYQNTNKKTISPQGIDSS